MAISVITGQEATSGTNQGILSNQIKIQMRDEILLLDPNKAPLTLLMQKAKKVKIKSFKYEWLEDERVPDTDRVNNSGGYTTGTTSIVVDNGAYFPTNSTVLVQRTGEVWLVTTVSTNTLTVTRSVGGTAATDINDNEQLTILGPAAAEGAAAETARATKKAAKHNFTEIIRDGFDLTRTLQQTETYGMPEFDYQRKMRAIDHAISIEKKMWFSERSDDSGDPSRRTMGGVEEVISTNTTDYGGVVTITDVFTDAESSFRYPAGSSSKLLFAAPAVVSNLSLLAAGRLEIVPKDKTFGINVMRLLTPHGEYNIVKHWLFTGDTIGKMAFVVDMNSLGYMYLQDTVLNTNIQTPGTDGRKDEFLTECTLLRMQEQTLAKWTNAA